LGLDARAVMDVPYFTQPEAAQIVRLGEDVALSRARAKIFWHHDKHVEAVTILRAIADQVGRDSPIDRAFAMREAAISAAKTDDWAQAESWFREAQRAAATVETDNMHAMAIGLEADRAVAAFKIGQIDQALRGLASSLSGLAKLHPEASLRAAYCHRVVRHTVLWMETTIDRRETLIDGRPIVMLPGTCSNPEPPSAITALPLGPLDLAWYMLAEAEISSGRDVGIFRSLRQNLKDGPILFMEVALRNRWITVDVANSDGSRLAADMSDYLAALAYLRSRDAAERAAFDVMSPPRGEVRPLSSSELSEAPSEAAAVDAILAFALVSLFRGRVDALLGLEANLVAQFGNQVPGGAVFQKWRGAASSLGPLDDVVARAIASIRSGAHIEPRALWEIGLRLFEKLRQSNFRGLLVPLVAAWLRGEWQRIIAEEGFRLSRPRQTVPGVEADLASGKNDEAFIASLLLSAAEAVGSPLGAAYESLLRDVARGGTPSELAGTADSVKRIASENSRGSAPSASPLDGELGRVVS
jgi:hypothetical protein